MDENQFRQTIREELEPVKQDLKELKEDVTVLKRDVKELSENVDAARGDIEHLHMDVRGIRDKEDMMHSRNKREIDEIKTHIGLPLMPDVPEI